MKAKLKRLCIYAKDIQIITGKSDRHGRNFIKEMKTHYKKKKSEWVTVKEFCQYTGLPMEDVAEKLI